MNATPSTCPKCGSPNRHEATFCAKCGASLGPVQPARKGFFDLTWREYLALILAGVWDILQPVLMPLTVGGGLSPFNLIGSVIVSIGLGLLLRPNLVLLPVFVLENIPFVSEIPSATIGAFYLIWQNHGMPLPRFLRSAKK